MDSSVKVANDAFGGAADKTAPAADTDWKAKAEELERQLQLDHIENGRLKKANAEIDALRKEMAELKARNRGESLLESVPKEDLASVPDEVLNASARIAGSAMDGVRRDIDERFAAIEARQRANDAATVERAKTDAAERIDREFPGFFDSVKAGGANADEWGKYKRFTGRDIADAFANGNVEALRWHVGNFYRNFLHVNPPSGDSGVTTAPEPRQASGGNVAGAGVSQGKVYTQDEFIGLYDKIEEARSRGDYAEMKRLNAEIKNAPSEGRVKDS